MNNFSKLLFATFLIISSCFSLQYSEAATLRAVILGNTNDELGQYISEGVSQMEKEMHMIAAYADLDLDLKIIKGDDFNSHKIMQTLERLKVEEDDVVFLFSFSHGYRDWETATPWPSIHIPSDYLFGDGIDQVLMTEILQEKKPRLLITMLSCCNSYLPLPFMKPNRVKRQVYFSVQNVSLVKKNYHHLFNQCRGTIMMSSSTPGNYSLAYDQDGEIFLHSFLKTLRNDSQTTVLSWEKLFNKAHKMTGEISLEVYRSEGEENQYFPQIEFINFDTKAGSY